MPFQDIPVLTSLNTVLGKVNRVLAEVLGIGPQFDAATALGVTIADAIFGVRTVSDSIKATVDGIGDLITDGSEPTTAALSNIESKVSNIQWMLTSSIGDPDVVNNYPNLDLRPLIDGIGNYAPGNGSLYSWLIYLLHQTVPNTATQYRHLGQIAGPATFALPDCWGLATHTITVPPGISRSANPDAPIQWFLGRVSFGRDGWYEASKAIQHEKQLFIPQGFVPGSVALECRPGAVIEVYAVMPYGYI